ncbi:MAG: endo-1,4-beta-xylanase, partial [Nocardioides sp.]
MKKRRPLWRLGAKKGLVVGFAHGTDDDGSMRPKRLVDLIADQGVMLTPEYDMLWGSVEPEFGTFTFERSDALVEWAQDRRMLCAGGHLVWHQTYIDGFNKAVTESGRAREIFSNHISTVAGRYAGKIWGWTVVNEAVEPDHGRKDGLRKTVWLKNLGRGYIEDAFHLARAADPHGLLFYNDYALETKPERREAVLRLLRKLVDAGAPIDGLGVQMHLVGGEILGGGFDPDAFAGFLDSVADLGLKIWLTELDVRDAELPADISERDAMVAAAVDEVLPIALNCPATVALTCWGISDRDTWLSDFAPRSDGLPVRPLPYDRALKAKPMRASIARAIRAMPARESSKP